VYAFLIDFDVDASVFEAGNSGNYNLHPVLRVSTETSTGSIRGIVLPGPYQVVASVVAGGQTISAYANDLGQFVIHGVPQGTYTLSIDVETGLGVGPVQIENVTVVNGEVTDVGNIPL
ncbi:MAG: carboxypeptidase regulatory-like domain-containing protein, partial [Flavobacterium sp.]|nr:carboxypeptidase regulatory-like domain-containing protein [Flavobacterium sp.]